MTRGSTPLRKCGKTWAWTIDYTATAKKQLRELDSQVAQRIVDIMGEHIATMTGSRSTGKVLTVPMPGAYWRYRVVDCRVTCDFKTASFVSW